MRFLIDVFLVIRYYSLDVSYFKSLLDKSLLEFLWNRYWVNTLSSSNLLTVKQIYFFLIMNFIFMQKTKKQHLTWNC
jgi:hypothetical protein